jgi:octanoyl-[GcvH]:protein N-octanoyltransferase
MINIKQGIPPRIRLLDTTGQVITGDALFPFAYEEVECRRIGKGEIPLIHLWRHERAFVLGLRDRKLPYAQEAMEWLKRQGYAVMVRHSGGGAVPLDKGVINLSILLPKSPATMDFKNDFQTMVEILQSSLGPLTQEVQFGEIFGSYCPGEYDLSIKGKKFCGIAQRRQTQAFMVQAFIVVEGHGADRAKLVQDFYNMAGGRREEMKYLKVQESSMASLSELLGLSNAEDFVTAVKEALKGFEADILFNDEYNPLLLTETEQMMSVIRQRYDR